MCTAMCTRLGVGLGLGTRLGVGLGSGTRLGVGLGLGFLKDRTLAMKRVRRRASFRVGGR